MRIIYLLLSVAILLGNRSNAQDNLLFYQGFEGSPIDSGWTVNNAPTSPGWTFGDNQFSGFLYPVPPLPELGAYAVANDELAPATRSADWLISPSVSPVNITQLLLDFHAYFTGSEGAEAHVILSFDNGATWNDTIYSMMPATSWQEISLNLDSYASNNSIKVGFLFSDNGSDEDIFAVDEVYLYEPIYIDLSVSDFDAPQTGCGLSPNETLMVEVTNNGLDDAQNFTIQYSLDGGLNFISQLVPTVLLAGTSEWYTFNITANFSQVGQYDLVFEVILPQDQVPGNNVTAVQTVTSLASIDQFPFTEDFESGSSTYFYFVSNDESNAGVISVGGNHVGILDGGTGGTWVGSFNDPSPVNAWSNNPEYISQINSCTVDATFLSSVELTFDLQQFATNSLYYSWFRLLVNGNPIPDVTGKVDFNPDAINGTLQELTYDLSDYAGSIFTIGFEGLNRLSSTLANPGNVTHIDNISITGTDTISNFVYPLPFYENFEGSPTNLGWTTESNGGEAWVFAADYFDSFWYPQSNLNTTIAANSNDIMCFNNFGSDCDKSQDYLVSPNLDFVNYDTLTLSLDYFFTGEDGSAAYLYIMTDNDWSSMQLAHTFAPLNAVDGWSSVTIDLTPFAGQAAKLVFHHDDGGSLGTGISIDNVFLSGIPSSLFVYTLPFVEDFEASPSNPGWFNLYAPGSDGFVYGANYFNTFWYPNPSGNLNNTIAANSNDALCSEANNSDCDKSSDYFVSPLINLYGYDTVDLSLDYFFTGDDGSQAYIYAVNDGDYTNLQLLHTFTGSTLGQWESLTIDMAGYLGDTVALVFHHNDGGLIGSGLSIDNVSLTGVETPIPTYQLPFSEDFEATPLTTGWRTSQAGYEGWVYAANYYNSFWYPIGNLNNTTAATSNDVMCFDNFGADCDKSNDLLISPKLDLFPYYSVEMSFDYFFTGEDNSTAEVWVMLNEDPNNFVLVETILAPPSNIGWQTATMDLSAFTQDTVQLVFRHSDNAGFGTGFSVDNLFIDGVLPQPIEYSFTTTDPSCYQSTDGTIDVVLSGGNGGLFYQWNTGDTGLNLTNLGAGIYIITVTDMSNQEEIIEIELFEVSPIVLTSSVSQYNGFEISCYNANDGSIDVMASGSHGGFTYAWSNGATSNLIDGLIAGNYALTVTDMNGCSFDTSFTLNQPFVIGTSSSVSPVSCNGGNDGAINFNISFGGVPPFQYNWSNGATTEDLSNLVAGSYSALIVDANGCQYNSNTFVISEPDPLALNTSLSDYNGFQVSCFGGTDGAITPSVTGGTTPYSYLWSVEGNATTSSISGLIAGTYTLTLTDANNCELVETYTLTEPTALELLSFEIEEVLCNGFSTGSISLTVQGGVGTYSFAWSNGATDEDLTNLPAGNYTLTINDDNACSLIESFTITEPAALLANESLTNISCFGGNDGSIQLSPSGGTEPYLYSWSNGETTSSLANLIAGPYSVTITDANLCEYNFTYTLTEPPLLTLSSTQIDVDCNGNNNGSINITTAGGVPPYAFLWNTGETTEDLSALSGGDYTLTVTDANACTTTLTVSIFEPDALGADEVFTMVTCNGLSDGAIDVTTLGGVAPYFYNWNTGANTEDIDNLPAGTYSLTITDANWCSYSESFVVTEPAVLAMTSVTSDFNGYGVSCFGANDGFIDLTVTGGTTPYNYAWSNGESTEDLSALIAGTYSVEITDANGCEISGSLTLPWNYVNTGENHTVLLENPPLVNGVSIESGDYVGAFYNDNGTLVCAGYVEWVSGVFNAVTVWGTEASLNNGFQTGEAFNWKVWRATDGEVIDMTASYSATFPNAGTYVTNGISGVSSLSGTGPAPVPAGSGSWILTTPDALTINLNSLNSYSGFDISCHGAQDGDIASLVTGGVLPYTYTWSNGETTTGLSDVGAGVYTLTITDLNGCTLEQSIELFEPDPLEISYIHGFSDCLLDNTGFIDITVTGGVPPFTYLWTFPNSIGTSTNEDLTGLSGGDYQIQIVDANGCVLVENYYLPQPANAIEVSLVDLMDISCNGANDGSIQVMPQGGVGPFTYLWDNGATTASISALAPGNYTVSITDANNCTNSQTYTINEPAILTLALSGDDVDCNGAATGSITSTVSGGVTPYTYAWSNGGTTANLIDLSGGSYSLTVTDANGCTIIETQVINEPAVLTQQPGGYTGFGVI